MAQFQGNKEYNTFVKGIITEASPLTFPENASIDEANFELLRTGQRARRLGLEFESGETPGVSYTVDYGWIQDVETDNSGGFRQAAYSPSLNLTVIPLANLVYYSSDGENWTTATSGINMRCIAWSEELGLFTGLGESGGVAVSGWSIDGTTWTSGTVPNNSGEWDNILWSSEKSLFVAVAQSGTGTNNDSAVMTSTDGKTWTQRSTPANGIWTSVDYGNGIFAAVGPWNGGAGDPVIMTSPDGETWTQRTPDAGEEEPWRSVAYSPTADIWVAVHNLDVAFSPTYRMMTSTDGITWTATNPNIGEDNRYTVIKWIDDLSLFVTVGEWSDNDDIFYTIYSADGVTWTDGHGDFWHGTNSQFHYDITYDSESQRLVLLSSEGGPISIHHQVVLSSTATDPQFDSDTEVLSSYIWRTEGTNEQLEILVVQIGTEIYFYDASAADIINSPLNGGTGINLGGDPAQQADFATIFGNLVVSNNQKGVHYLTYDVDSDTVTVEVRNILVRDIWGVDDGLAITKRPSNLSQEHEYNLVNQGWGERMYFDEAFRDLYYKDLKNYPPSVYPSNTDIVSAGKNPATSDSFEGGLIFRNLLGNTPAPKGFFIIDAFRRGSSRSVLFTDKRFTVKSSEDSFTLSSFLAAGSEWTPNKAVNNVMSLPRDETSGGVRSVTSYAGRVWFTGADSTVIDGDDRSPNLGSYVFFSQIVDSEENIGKCYQDGDPTSEDFPDILDTDGGAIKIPGMYGAFKLITSGRAVLVFADNGIWEVSGGETNFTATNFEIRKISNTRAISPQSIVEVEGSVMFWAEEGIYLLGADEITGGFAAKNISETTIQSLVDDVPTNVKRFVKGDFDPVSRKVRWLYNPSSSTFANDNRITLFESELIFDLVLQAFYVFDVTTTAGFYLADHIISNTITDTAVDKTVEDSSGATVTNSSGEDVVVGKTVTSVGDSSLKYLASNTLGYYGIATLTNTDFEDFGNDAPAFLITGYEILDNSMVQKQAPYIIAHFEQTETSVDGSGNVTTPSSCVLQTRWDFADSTSSGKFGSNQQLYRLPRNYLAPSGGGTIDYGKSVVTSKTKIRGRGRALSLKFSTEAAKDLRIYGWGVKYTGVQNV